VIFGTHGVVEPCVNLCSGAGFLAASASIGEQSQWTCAFWHLWVPSLCMCSGTGFQEPIRQLLQAPDNKVSRCGLNMLLRVPLCLESLTAEQGAQWSGDTEKLQWQGIGSSDLLAILPEVSCFSVNSKAALLLPGYGTSWVSFGVLSVFLLWGSYLPLGLGLSTICHLAPSPSHVYS
jgi:hypothetical protein